MIDRVADRSPEAIVSDRIRVIRVVAILLVTIVHLQPGLSEIDGAPYLVETLRFMLINTLGYASVPILSVISGYLLVNNYDGKNWADYAASRFLTLYVPLITWSSILALVVIGLHLLGFSTSIYKRLSHMEWYDALFALTDRPINYPLYFLRDIFVLSLFAPFIVPAARRAPFLLLLAAVACFVLNFGSPVLLRPMTFLFFSVGAVLAARNMNMLRLDQHARLILIVSLVFWCGMIAYLLEIRQTENIYSRVKYLDLVNRLAVALVFWVFADNALRYFGRNLIRMMEQRIFIVFLSHVVVITIVGGAFNVIFGGFNNYFYIPLFLSIPFLCYTAGAILFRIISFSPRALQIAFMGKHAPLGFMPQGADVR